jgi:hypothetical protein
MFAPFNEAHASPFRYATGGLYRWPQPRHFPFLTSVQPINIRRFPFSVLLPLACQ